MLRVAGLAYVAAAIVLAGIAVVARRREAHNPSVAASLMGVMAGACWWSGADAVAVLATNETVAAVATLAAFAGASSMVAAFVCLGLSLARPHAVLGRRLVTVLLVQPALVTAAAVTNPWHQLLLGGPGAAELTGSAGWTYGPLFWLDTTYGYLALAVGTALVVRSGRARPPSSRLPQLLLVGACVLPFAANIAYRSGVLGRLPDPTPVGFAIAAAIVSLAIVRQDVLAFSPVARALIVDQLRDAVVVVSPRGRVLDLNLAAIELLRLVRPTLPADLVGRPAADLLGRLHAPQGEWREVSVDVPGGRTHLRVRASPLVDRRHRDLGVVYVGRDVTEANAQKVRMAAAHARLVGQNAQLVRQLETIERLRAELVEQANRDPLTGLHNRRHMVERLASMIATAERTSEPFAVVLFDVDRFKSINDRLGHLAGDQVLVALARRMGEQVPAGGLIARWGGEEFLIALPGVDAAAGLAFAEALRRRCERLETDVAGRAISCTLSGGVAAYPASGTTMTELFHAADVALYAAKEAGRNVVRDRAAIPGPVALDAEAR